MYMPKWKMMDTHPQGSEVSPEVKNIDPARSLIPTDAEQVVMVPELIHLIPDLN